MISETLVEAVELARGGAVLKYPAPEFGDHAHAAALLAYEVRIRAADDKEEGREG